MDDLLGQKNRTALFQGDSITDCGRDRTRGDDLGTGYPARIAKLWERLRPGSGWRFLNRGISGNRAQDLLARYEEDFRDLKPDLVSILIGINDTWRRYDSGDPTSTGAFERDYRTLLEKLRRDLPQTRLVMMEPFLIKTVPEKDWREDLDPKIEAVRKLAGEFAVTLIPLDTIFTGRAAGIRGQLLAADGVHPTPQGHDIIAQAWLEALGLSAAGS